MSDIVNKMQQEIINRSNEFEEQTKGTKDEYNIYREHIQYVYRYVLLLSKDKDVDKEVLELSALLHDIAMTDKSLDRSKHNEYGSEIAEQLLRENNYPEDKIQFVKKCILNHSSKRAEYRTTEEEKILVNADGLSHFDSINNLYNLAHNVMKLNDEDTIKFIQNKLTRDYNEISNELKYLINDKYDRVMNATNINEILDNNEYYDFYIKNFPYIYREDKTTREIINNEGNKYIEKRNDNNELIGLSIINNNTILLLCVDSKYRGQGIGSKLLEESENLIINNGYEDAILGVGFNYLMPGIPTSNHYFKSEHENIYSIVDDNAEKFFTQKGYINTSECDYFDMGQSLDNFNYDVIHIGDVVDGIEYRFANESDIDDICICTDDAEENFTKYYKMKEHYSGNSRVIIATVNGEVAGTMMMGLETEGNKVGDLAVATTKHKYRNRHISANLTNLATQFLKDNNMEYAHLNYTYTGLDHVYGYAGYEICVYYTKASKQLVLEKNKSI